MSGAATWTNVFPNGIVLGKAAARGAKVDPAAPTFPWLDLKGPVVTKDTGPTAPTYAVFRGGAVKKFFFSAGNVANFEYHVDHDHVLNSDVFLHAHWGHNGTAISGNMILDFAVTYAKGHNQSIYAAEITPQLTVSTPNIGTIPRWSHVISEFQLSASSPSATQLNSALLEPDGEICIAMTVNTIPTITGGSRNEPYISFVDIHYQSRGIGTKQKTPDFYT